MEQTLKYPIGVQDFEKVRLENYLYIDKTALIYKLVTTGSYYFLSRPRRFGKSLLISTLEAYFSGKKELFKGLAIERLEKDWQPGPVFHLDLNTGHYDSVQGLIDVLNEHLKKWEAEYGVGAQSADVGLRFAGVVENACKQSGQRVAILVDEYDKPLLQNIGHDELQEQLRSVLRTFYSVIKTKDRYIRFGLLTGVSKFGKLSVFSDLNSPKDISMDARYVGLCGITEKEILDNLSPDIQQMADKYHLSYDEMLNQLKKKYDGYHFERESIGIYNPFSLLSALDGMSLNDYWFETGTPTFLVKLLQKADYNLNGISQEEQTADALNSIENAEANPVPMLYQSGYLTINGYDERFGLYRLGFPNEEVETGFTRFLLPAYCPASSSNSEFSIPKFVRDVETGQVDQFLERLQTLFEDNSYQVQGKMEIYFQNVMFIVFKLMGFYVQVERTTARGRIDLVMTTKDYIYVMELKLDGSADEALKQISDKGYAAPYAQDPRKLFKVGINFSSETRGISEWKVAE